MTTSDVSIEEGRDHVKATTTIDAPAAAIFDIVRQPAQHTAISGDGTVRSTVDGPERLELGSRFGMRMRLGVPYRIHSKVVAYEPDRMIAWQHIGGHRWIWRLEPDGAGRTTVSETFDMSTSRFPPALRLVGYPGKHRDNVTASVRNLKRIVEASG